MAFCLLFALTVFIYLVVYYSCSLFQETESNGTIDTSCYDYGWASFGTVIQSPYLRVS